MSPNCKKIGTAKLYNAFPKLTVEENCKFHNSPSDNSPRHWTSRRGEGYDTAIAVHSDYRPNRVFAPYLDFINRIYALGRKLDILQGFLEVSRQYCRQ
jgi:hypothetical protein